MKSAYELAMERLEREAPAAELTEAQKRTLADIEEKFKARLAEKEIFLGDLIAKARAAGDSGEIAELEQQLARERERLRSRCEAEKSKVREG